ncbi:MAG: hypothetical protein Q7S80_00535 [bacterium]|nr:hypothetical protein [bacterium]
MPCPRDIADFVAQGKIPWATLLAVGMPADNEDRADALELCRHAAIEHGWLEDAKRAGNALDKPLSVDEGYSCGQAAMLSLAKSPSGIPSWLQRA